MEDLLSLNASSKSIDGKIKKFDNLSIGEYFVKSFKLKETQFGLRVYVEIDDFYLVLPARFSDKINSTEQLEELNENKFKMVYKGKNKDEFNKLMIDFVQLKDAAVADNSNAPNDEENVSEDDDDEEFDRKRRSTKRKGGDVSSKVQNKRR